MQQFWAYQSPPARRKYASPRGKGRGLRRVRGKPEFSSNGEALAVDWNLDPCLWARVVQSVSFRGCSEREEVGAEGRPFGIRKWTIDMDAIGRQERLVRRRGDVELEICRIVVEDLVNRIGGVVAEVGRRILEIEQARRGNFWQLCGSVTGLSRRQRPGSVVVMRVFFPFIVTSIVWMVADSSAEHGLNPNPAGRGQSVWTPW